MWSGFHEETGQVLMKKERNNFKETFGLEQVTLFAVTLRSCFPRGMFQGLTARYVLIIKRNRIVTEIDCTMQWKFI